MKSQRISRGWSQVEVAIVAAAWCVAAMGCNGGSPAERARTGAAARDGERAVLVLVAASASNAVEEIAAAFQREHGIEVRINAGPTNALASQIIAGAPADLFISASEAWADAVQEEGLADQVRPLVTSELVLIVPRGNPAAVHRPADLVTPNARMVAVAGENVPAGLYGAQALASADVYKPLVEQGKIARGHDVRVTLSYVELGEAEAGIVYATDALLSQRIETVYAFPPSSHEPIVYPLVLLKSANPAARSFFAYLTSHQAERVFEKHGFAVLGGTDDERQGP